MALLEREVGAGTAGADSGQRPVVSPRRSLPNGRAVLGGLLVTLAALAAFATATGSESGPSMPVVVASRDIPPGHHIAASDVAVVLVDVPEGLAAQTYAAAADVVDHVTLGPVGAGALVQRTIVRPVGVSEAMAPFVTSLAVEAERAIANRLVAGETVAVLSTYGTGADAYTIVVVPDAVVVDVSSADADLVSRAETILTLGVRDRATMLALVHADRAGEVTVARTDGSSEGRGDAYRPPNEPGG